jgi:hypothetical protein
VRLISPATGGEYVRVSRRDRLGLTPDLTTRDLWRSRRWARERGNFLYLSLWDFKSSFTCRKILLHGTFLLYFPFEREVCCRFLSPLKIHGLGRFLNLQPLGPVASTLTTTPPRRPIDHKHVSKLYMFIVCQCLVIFRWLKLCTKIRSLRRIGLWSISIKAKPLTLSPHSRVFEKLIVAQLIKRFCTFHGTRKFITMFARACSWILLWAVWIQSTPHVISVKSILMLLSHLCLRLPTCHLKKRLFHICHVGTKGERV